MNKKLKDSLPLLSIVFAVLIALMMVFSVLRTDGGDSIMSGFTAIFGGEVASIGGFASVDVNFSLVNFFAFLLPLIFTVGIFMLTRNSKGNDKINILFNVLIFASFIYSLIILVNLGTYTEGTATLFGGTVSYSYEGASLALGAILAIIFAVSGIITSLLKTILIFK
ncbi:MAG: hypothetical protein PF513_04910 [Tenericutes bacterium]|jgi:hypothetical protein|nr:hypothetical protein [Mycoplasmatota bacterium]